LVYPAKSQVQHGSVGVVYFTKDKIVMAADSRQTRSGAAGVSPTDDGCKVTALDGNIIFVSTNIVRFLGGPRVSGWDNDSMIRAVYSKVKSVNSGARGHLAEIAKEWSDSVAAKFNAVASLEPGIFRQMTSDIGAGAFTVAYMGGLDGAGNPGLFVMAVTPNASRTAAEGSEGPIRACSNHDFCAVGVLDIVVEFANASSGRARKEAAEWKPPKGTPPKDYDAFKTMRMVELTIQHHAGPDLGGPIDAVQLNRDGSLHWYARKRNCPEN
jgi:hypothetical protein